MATDIERLVVQLSADFKSFEKSLARQQGISNRQFSAIERRARQMNKNLDGIFARSFDGLKGSVAAIGAALGVDQLRRMTDTWTDLTSRVNLAAGSIDKGAEVMGRLGEMARRTYSDLTQTAESYLGNATAVKELGYSTDQTLDYTESLNNALVVSGAKGDRAASVIEALSKAMALGKLSGDNLNTVISTGGRVAEALAAGLGTTVNGLRKLGAQGKITGQDIVKGLSSQMEVLRKEAADMPATIGDGFTLLNNALLQYVGNGDQANGVSAKIAEALVLIADNFDKVADAGLQVAAVIAGALIGRSITSMIRSLSLGTTALISFARALNTARAAGGLAAALGGVSAAAGPVGLVIGGAVVSSLILYNSTSGQASEGAKLFAARLQKVEEAAKASGDAVEEAGKQNASYNLNSIKEEVKAGSQAFESAKQSVREYFDEIIAGGIPIQKTRDEMGKMSRQPMATPEQFQQLTTLRDELSKNADRAEYVKKALQALANSNPNFQALADQLNPLLDKLINVATAARQANALLADKNASRGRSAKDDQLPIDVNKIAADSYEKEALRKASLNKKEHTLELERIKVRNDAMREGTKLTEDAIDRIARANVAAQSRWTEEGKKPKKEKAVQKSTDQKIDSDIQAIKDRTAALQAETQMVGLSYQEQEKRRIALDLEQAALAKLRDEAIKKGQTDLSNIKISPEQLAQIDEVSAAYARQAEELRKVQEVQDRADQATADFYDTFRSSMVGAIRGANSLADALKSILGRLSELLLNSAFNALFMPSSGGTGGGKFGGPFDWIGGIIGGGIGSRSSDPWSGLRLAGGGHVRGPGGPRTDSIPANLSDGEFVVNAKATKQNRRLLEAINKGKALSMAKGGLVSITAPTMPNLRSTASSQHSQAGGIADVRVYVDQDGNWKAEVERISQRNIKQGFAARDKGSAVRTANDLRQVARYGYAK